jgi:hypothetical protein
MERRLDRLAILMRPTLHDATRERQLTGQFVFAIDIPSGTFGSDPPRRLEYFQETIERSRLPASAVARALVAALAERGCDADEVREAIRVEGIGAMLAVLARWWVEHDAPATT